MGKGRSAQRSAFDPPFAAILQVNYGFKMMFFFLSVVVLMNLLIAQVRSRQPGLCAHDRVLRIGVHDIRVRASPCCADLCAQMSSTYEKINEDVDRAWR